MADNAKVTVDDTSTKEALIALKQQVMWALPGAINNSLREIQDTINSDYRRFGQASPAYQNPSRSGLGFTDRTGRLRSSIRYNTKISSSKIVGTLNADTEYALFVEQLWGGRYAYMLPALEENHDTIFDQVVMAVERAVDRARR